MERQPLRVGPWPLGTPAATARRLGFRPVDARTPGMVLGAGTLAVMYSADGNRWRRLEVSGDTAAVASHAPARHDGAGRLAAACETLPIIGAN